LSRYRIPHFVKADSITVQIGCKNRRPRPTSYVRLAEAHFDNSLKSTLEDDGDPSVGLA